MEQPRNSNIAKNCVSVHYCHCCPLCCCNITNVPTVWLIKDHLMLSKRFFHKQRKLVFSPHNNFFPVIKHFEFAHRRFNKIIESHQIKEQINKWSESKPTTTTHQSSVSSHTLFCSEEAGWWYSWVVQRPHCMTSFLPCSEFGMLRPTWQFVVRRRGRLSFHGRVPLTEDWAGRCAGRTSPLAHHHSPWNKDVDAKAHGVTSSCVISLKYKWALRGLVGGWKGDQLDSLKRFSGSR